MTQADCRIRDATQADIETIRALAGRIWRACYPGIITPEQIEYMLGWMYAAEKIRDDMLTQQVRYLIVAAPEAAGFAAYGPGDRPDEVFLHKLYIDPARQRIGLGTALLGEIVTRATAGGAARLALRVNRRNRPAIRTYEKNGFVISGEDVADIGGGFAMDDYLMTRPLGAAPG